MSGPCFLVRVGHEELGVDGVFHDSNKAQKAGGIGEH